MSIVGKSNTRKVLPGRYGLLNLFSIRLFVKGEVVSPTHTLETARVGGGLTYQSDLQKDGEQRIQVPVVPQNDLVLSRRLPPKLTQASSKAEMTSIVT